jgi:prephenate dehydratase
VAYQGERGAYGEKAIRHWFSGDVKALPVPEFPNVFEAVLEGRAAFGIVPIENSLTGSIHQNYDLLLQYPDIRIVGEQKIRIEHNLITLPQAKVEDIRRVYSHPQGLAQCSRFLDEHPQWERVAFYDTAGAARFVAEKASPENAAIASAEAAAVYGLSVLRQGLETNVQNYTRFFVIAREADTPAATAPREKGKASLSFSVADQPGALFKALQVLADQGLNMKKLESRPILGKPWQYLFYIDVDLPADPAVLERCVEKLSAVTEDLRVLGTYRAG